MTELDQLLATSPEDLAKLQHDELQNHTLNVLRTMSDYIKAGDYQAAEDMTFHSPAGDEMGCDNDCIQFTYDPEQDMDILDVVERLGTLQEQAQSGQKSTASRK